MGSPLEVSQVVKEYNWSLRNNSEKKYFVSMKKNKWESHFRFVVFQVRVFPLHLESKHLSCIYKDEIFEYIPL